MPPAFDSRALLTMSPTNYLYDHPTDPVFSFVLFAFTASVVTLLVTDNPNFAKPEVFEPVCTVFILLTVYAVPGAIIGRVVFASPLNSESETPIHKLIRAQFVVCLGLLVTTIVVTFLQCGLSGRYITIRNIHQQHTICKRRWLWHLNMFYFALRYFVPYMVYSPFSIACGLVFAITRAPPQLSEDSYFTFAVFIVALAAISAWMWCHLSWWQSITHSFYILNEFILCYLVANDSYLVQLLLSWMAIYLAALFGKVRRFLDYESEPEMYNTWMWWWFQLCYPTKNGVMVARYRLMKPETFEKYRRLSNTPRYRCDMDAFCKYISSLVNHGSVDQDTPEKLYIVIGAVSPSRFVKPGIVPVVGAGPSSLAFQEQLPNVGEIENTQTLVHLPVSSAEIARSQPIGSLIYSC